MKIPESGLININKPAGLTSHDVVARVRRKLGIKRVGHTGTLDPMATGVLPVAFGKATRIIEYYDNDLKTYEAEMKLGITTDTLDITGETLETREFSGISEENVRKVFSGMIGEIEQIPPKYSALKVGGKRLYEYAREGKDVEIKPRKTYVDSIVLTCFDHAEGTVRFTVVCSKGTYIRTICDDAGRMLGCGAAMTALTRTQSGYFTIEDSIDLDEFMEMGFEDTGGPEEHADASFESGNRVFIPMDETLLNLSNIYITSEYEADFRNGKLIPAGIMGGGASFAGRRDFSKIYKVYGYRLSGAEFIGIGIMQQDGMIKPEKVIAQGDAR
jgi:tRNA pseudouridine55 synthase